MKARQLIGSASFGPDVLKVVYQAFDAAWNDVKGTVGDNPLAIEAARLRLANVILSLASDSSRDAGVLTADALRIFNLERRPSC